MKGHVSIPAVVASLVIVATACTSATPNQPSANSSTPTATAIAAASKPPAPVTLRFQSFRLADTVSGPLYSAWIARYQEQNPHVTIQQDPVPIGQRLEKFTAQVLAGDPPDIVGLGDGDLAQFAALGQLENLDPFYDQEGAAFEDGFAPVALQMSKYNGSYYAITHELSGQDAIWYNHTLLRDANIDAKDALSTWDKFVEASKALSGNGKYAIAIRGKDVTNSVSVLWSYMAQKTGPLVTEDDIKANLCTPGPKEVFRSYIDLYTIHGVTANPVDVDFNFQLQGFSQKNTAFLDQGSWMSPIIDAENPEMKGNYSPLPKPLFEGGKPTMQTVALSMMLPKGGKNVEEAWKFIKFITSKELQLENVETTSFMPSLVELINTPRIQDDPIFGVFATEMAQYGYPRPSTPKLNEMWTALHREFQEALLKNKTADEAFDDACGAILGIIG